MKRVALLMFALALLAPAIVGASNEQRTSDATRPTVRVPEPATITLLAVGAGAVVARKWRNRQR